MELKVVDITAKPGFEVSEVSHAKELIEDFFYTTDLIEDDLTRSRAIILADAIVEALINIGWRPTDFTHEKCLEKPND